MAALEQARVPDSPAIPELPFTPEGLAKVNETLLREGVVIIRDVFPPDETRAHLVSIVNGVCTLSRGVAPATGPDTRKPDDGLDPHDPSTWTDLNKIPGPRNGLIQFGPASNMACVWDVRADKRLGAIFRAALNTDADLVTSIDGLNVCPPPAKPRNPRVNRKYPLKTDEWAHYDQYVPSGEMSVQGQVVLNNSTGGLRVSPRSHLVHEQVLKLNTDRDPTSIKKWEQLRPEDYEAAKALIEDVGGSFQQRVPPDTAGCVILWRSDTLHSATAVEHAPDLPPASETDPFPGMRCVVYVSQRKPRDLKHIRRLRTAFSSLRATNHSGERLFGLDTGRGRHAPTRNTGLAELIAAPHRAREIQGLYIDDAGIPKHVGALLGIGLSLPTPHKKKKRGPPKMKRLH